MSYTANQYNYATPYLSTAFFTESSAADLKYFTLHNNALDGTFVPVSGDVGIWGVSVSGTDGLLNEPLQVNISKEMYINAFNLHGSVYAFPVDFTVLFYKDYALVHDFTVIGNGNPNYIRYLKSTVHADNIIINVTRISSEGNVARLLNAYNPGYVKRSDNAVIKMPSMNVASQLLHHNSSDKLGARIDSATPHITNIISKTFDTLSVSSVSNSIPTNVHTRMKESSRRVFGRVYITYTDPMLEVDTTSSYSSIAHNSNAEQLTDTLHETDGLYFTLYDNDLSGRYRVSDENSQVGWSSAQLSNEDGYFEESVWAAISFEPRPVKSFTIAFDTSHGNLVKDFNVILTNTDFSVVNYEYTDNTEASVVFNSNVADIRSIAIEVLRVEKPFSPATILGIPLSSTILYKGYEDESNLISIDMLEELTYEDDIEMLGGVSANKVDVTLDNSDKSFFFNSGSLVANQLKRNRKIIPHLGVEVVPNEIEWHTLGTFWSYNWHVPTDSLYAKVTGFDTIGLLSKTSFTEHTVLVDKSIADLIRYVLDDAAAQLDFIEYIIHPSLEEIIIPYAWFANSSHTAALRKISGCYPVHIYCDRQGRICAMPQNTYHEYYIDTWSNSTNVIRKTYSSLHTVVPNIVNVSISKPFIGDVSELVNDNAIRISPTNVILTFNKPYVDNALLFIDCDDSVKYTHTIYSWGIVLNFTGDGYIRSIICSGRGIEMSNAAVITDIDADSVRLNGGVTRDIASDFIQTESLARELISRFRVLAAHDIYDASVEYRGNIALTINDPIILEDGIAPLNTYSIKRHQLYWDGALSGSADLNT